MFGRILVADDDPVTCEILHEYLTAHNFEVIVAGSGQEAIQKIKEIAIDLVLLDLVLPDMDGNEVALKIRQESLLPIIMISTRNSDADKAISLGIGGDDYLTKPISHIELIARIKAHLRRYQSYGNLPGKKQVIQIGPICLDESQRKVWGWNREITLTTREYNLLRIFMLNAERVLTKDQLFSLVWGDEFFDDNTLMVAIRRLRAKIEENPSKPKLIHTVWGAGYRFAWKESS